MRSACAHCKDPFDPGKERYLHCRYFKLEAAKMRKFVDAFLGPMPSINAIRGINVAPDDRSRFFQRACSSIQVCSMAIVNAQIKTYLNPSHQLSR